MPFLALGVGVSAAIAALVPAGLLPRLLPDRAADATPVVVRVVGIAGHPAPRDQWMTVTGNFQEVRGEVPELAATSVVEVPAPDDPYE
jgi:hypothetical protein